MGRDVRCNMANENQNIIGAGQDTARPAPKTILDMCCGPRMMWFDKSDPRAVYLDRRMERHAMHRPKRGTVEYTETIPDVLSDFTALPFRDNTFSMVVFDPPHFVRSGKIGFLAMKYGWLDADWREMLCRGFSEGFRVLCSCGTLIFKWTATDNPVKEILTLTPYRPLFGHKSGKQANTHWLTFRKEKSPVLGEGSPAQNTMEICHTAPNRRNTQNAQVSMDL